MYQRTDLNNGIRIVSHEIPQRETIALGIWIAVGGRYENDQNKGIAHFLEHILFKGSRKYSCEAIKESIEGVGGSLNAFTSEEMTCYYAKIPSKHLNKTFDVLSDMVLNPLMGKEDTARESTVIIEEIKMYHDLPPYLVMEHLDEMIWPQHPLGKNLAGTPETIARLRPEDLKNFHRDYYYPSRIVISAVGKLKHDSLTRSVKARFKGNGSGGHFDYVPAPSAQNKPKFKFHHKQIEQIHLAMGVLAFDEEHRDIFALHLFNVIMGGNMSSRLFNEVREKKGLAYSIASLTKAFADTGSFYIRAGVDSQKVVPALEIIFKEIDKVKQKGVSDSEFRRAKDFFFGQLVMSLEDTLDHMFWIGDATVSRNRFRTLQEVIAKVKQVTPDDIKRVAKELLTLNRYNLSMVGPLTSRQETEARQFLQ